MTLVHPAEDISLSPALHREPSRQTHIQVNPEHEIQYGNSYSCPECKHLFHNLDSYNKHLQNAHPKPQAACKLCHKVYKTVKSLRRHEKSHGEKAEPKPKKVGDLPCPNCHKKFSTQTALHWHIERCHAEMPSNNTCPVCGKELADHANLKRHLEMVHSLESASCSICKKTFKSLTNLQRHVNITHPPEDAAQTCATCNKTFKCSLHLRIHIRTVHAAETVFNCDVCNKGFPSKKYMLKHKKTHVDVKAFPCSICSKMFKSSDDAKKHAKRVHMKTEAPKKASKKSSVCEICHKEFSRRKYMLLHKKIHVDVKSYSCEFCSKLFKCISHVRKHTKRLHLNPVEPNNATYNMFICDVCKKSFNSRINMVKHIKTHFALRELPCGICDKLFKCNSDVNKHLKRVHMKGIEKKNTEIVTKTVNTTTNMEYNDALKNIEFADEVLTNTKYSVKALEITAYTDEVPRSEDYRLETLRSAEYTVEMLGNAEYTLAELKTTVHTETMLSNTDFTEETLISTEYAKEVPVDTEFTEEALSYTEYVGNPNDSTKYTDKNLERRKLEVVHGSAHATVNAVRNTDILKDAIDISDFTMEDLGITEDVVESTKCEQNFRRTGITENLGIIDNTNEIPLDIKIAVKAPDGTGMLKKIFKKTDIIKDAIAISDFTIEDLEITEEPVETTKPRKALDSTVFIQALESKEYVKEVTNRDELPDMPLCGNRDSKKDVRHTDIIKEAIEISDFTMEDLQLTEYKENVVESTKTINVAIDSTEIQLNTYELASEETLKSTVMFESLKDTDFTDKPLGNTDIMQEAMDSAFTMEDLEMTDVGSTVPKKVLASREVKENDAALENEGILEAFVSSVTKKEGSNETDLTDEVVENTGFTDTAFNNTDIITNAIESSDFSIEDLGLAEYTPDPLETPAYSMEDLGITECPEVLESTEFIQEALCTTEFAKKTGNIEFTEALRSTEFTESALGFIEEALGNAEYPKPSTSTEFSEKGIEAVDFLEDAFRNTESTEEALRNREFEEELGSANFIEALDKTECSKSPNATVLVDKVMENDIMKDTIDSEFAIGELGTYNEFLNTDVNIIDDMKIADDPIPLNIELLNCLKCGIDFENDFDLHTHLCGGEMTLLLDFQDM